MAFENYGSQNVYQNQDQKGAASLVGSAIEGYGKAQNLSQIGLQNKHLEQQNEAQKRADYMQKAETFGGEMHAVASLPPEQQPEAYARSRQQLIQAGIATPEQAPEQFDPNYLRQMATKYQQMAPHFAEQKKNLAQANLFNAEASAKNAELSKRSGPMDYSDPAKMIASVVPKEHQTQAFKEVDAAENTKHMAQSIMDSFDQAVKDTSGVGGSLSSLVKTPRSALSLHQAMQPTFKDLEGTVRQAAMDNTFKNITPTGADTAQDIATKRQALADYLQSKSSSPIARAYGVDLAKFPSTAKYESAAPEVSGRVVDKLGGMMNSASAEPSSGGLKISKGGSMGGYIFSGGDPKNPKNWKKP